MTGADRAGSGLGPHDLTDREPPEGTPADREHTEQGYTEPGGYADRGYADREYDATGAHTPPAGTPYDAGPAFATPAHGTAPHGTPAYGVPLGGPAMAGNTGSGLPGTGITGTGGTTIDSTPAGNKTVGDHTPTRDTTGGQMEGHGQGSPGFAAGPGVWQPLPQGAEFDAEGTAHFVLPELPDLPDLTGLPPAEGHDPLAAPGPGGREQGERRPPQSPSPSPSAADGPAQEHSGPGEHPDPGGTADFAGPAEPAPGVPEAPPVPEPPSVSDLPDDSGHVPSLPLPEPPHLEHPQVSYMLRVNGADRPVADAWLGESLLYVLRERLGLAGAKDGCEQGECGACSVQVDGRLVASCLVPAATAAGCDVRTVEGLPAGGEPSDVQRALAECGAVQCGYCVPGLAMAVHDLLAGNHAPTELQTRQALSGNLCRCTGYRGVLAAVREVIASREAAAEAEAGEDGAGDGTVHIPHQAGPHGTAPEGPVPPGSVPPGAVPGQAEPAPGPHDDWNGGGGIR